MKVSLRAYLALAVAIGGITWSAIFVRWAGIPGSSSAFYRVLIAGLVLIPWALARGPRRPVSARTMWLAIGGGVFFALDLGLWNTSVMMTQAAVASILGNNTPFFVGMISWLIFHKRPRASF